MTGSHPYRPRHSHPINGLSLIPQHVLNSNRNTPSPRLARPAIDPYKAFTADDLDGFVDSITSKIRNALLGNTPTDTQPKPKTHARTSDVFGKLQSIPPSNHSDIPLPGPSGSKSAPNPPGDAVSPEEADEDSEEDDQTSIQLEQKTNTHIAIDSDDDILISSPPDARAVLNRTRQISSGVHSSSDEYSDDPDSHSESNDRGSDSSSDRDSSSQDLDGHAGTFLNNKASPDQGDIVSIDDSMEENASSISHSSHSQRSSSDPEPAREQRPRGIEDEASSEDSIETDSSSPSIVFQSRRPSSKPPTSMRSLAPGAQPSYRGEIRDHHEDTNSYECDDDDDDEEDTDDSGDDEAEDTDDSDDDNEEDGSDIDDDVVAADDLDIDADGNGFYTDAHGDNPQVDAQIADIAVDLSGEDVEAAKLPSDGLSRELEDREIEESEVAKGEEVQRSPSSDQIDLAASDISVDEPYVPVHENINDLDQDPHPDVIPAQPSGSIFGCPVPAGLRKLSRMGSFSADGAMIFRPSSESSVNLDSEDWAPEDGQKADKARAIGVEDSPIGDLDLPDVLDQSKIPDHTQPQSPCRLETHRAHSELVQDDYFLPMSPVAEPPPGLDEANVRDEFSSQDLPIEPKDADHETKASPQVPSPASFPTEAQAASTITEVEGAPQVASLTCHPTEAPSTSNKTEIPPEDQEDQAEDDNDLFEGDEDLRLHRLGVAKPRFDYSNQNEEASLPNIAPSNEEVDRFSSIEKQLESYMARAEEPRFSGQEEKNRRAGRKPAHPSSIRNSSAITTSPSAVVHTVIQQPLETDSQVVDNPDPRPTVQDAHLPTPSDEIQQHAVAVPQTDNVLVSTAEEAHLRPSPTDQDDAARPLFDTLWGQLSPAEGVAQATQETRMDEVDFFPLKQSDTEILNAASWTPALSTSISPDPNHESAQLYGSTETKYSIISLTLPQRSNFRQTLTFDDDPESIVEAPSGGHDEMHVPSKHGLQQVSPSHDQEDYDMLASSLIDGNSDIGFADPHKAIDKAVSKKHIDGLSGDSSMLSRADQTGADKPQDDTFLCGGQSIQNLPGADAFPSVQSSQLARPTSEDPVRYPSLPKASNSVMEESEADILLSQFINCSNDGDEVPSLDDQPAPASPVPSAAVVPAVTFATSPPTEMMHFERFDDHPAAADTQSDIMLNVDQPISAFEPQTPRTSTTAGQRTSSECSERHLSRGSAYSAPSSVVSSDALSVPASVAPPPPLQNASMGAPTEAVGLSNQMTRRSSTDSSTHAEPPSPSTSTRHRSAPITQEQVNAPGLPHIEAAEGASPPPGGLPDPLRSPPLLTQHLIPPRPPEIHNNQIDNNPVSRASSMVARAPSSSCSNLLEGSHMSIGTSHRGTSPQLGARLHLPNPIATPLPVSVPAIKLEDLPNACLSIERHRFINSSAASQAATSPRFDTFPSIIPPTTQPPDALIEKNVQAVGEVNSFDNRVSSAWPSRNTLIATHHDQTDGSASPHSSKVLDTDKRSEPSQEPTTPLYPQPQIQSTDRTKGDEMPHRENISKSPDPLPDALLDTPAATPGAALLLIKDEVDSTELKQDSTIGETVAPQPDIHPDPATNEGTSPAVEVEVNLAANGEADPVVDVTRDVLTEEEIHTTEDAVPEPTTDEVRNPPEVVDHPEAQSQHGPITRHKRKRQSTPKGPTGATRSGEIEAEEQEEQDRESQLREILRSRRASKQLTPQTVPPPPKQVTNQINQTSPTIEPKKKKEDVVKRDVNRSKGEATLEGEPGPNLPPDATEVASKGPSIRSSLPRAAKRSSLAPNSLAPPAQIQSPSNTTPRSVSPCPPPSSPLTLDAGDESSNSLLGFERDDQSLIVRNRQSSKDSRSTASPIPPASTVSIMIPQLQPDDLIPKLRLHQHNSKSKLFGHPTDHQAPESSQQHGTDVTESKPVAGARSNRRKSEGTSLPPSLPPVTRSHCHFIRLQFPKDVGRRFDTFLVPQCATGDEEIKKKMKALAMIEDDNLTGEEQSRGIRIGPDGRKHSDERAEHPSLLTLKPEHAAFAVDYETLNILIDVFGLSLIQDGQVEVLLPKLFFARFDGDDDDEQQQQEWLRRSGCERGRSSSAFSSRTEAATGATTSRNTHNRLKRRAHSPASSLYSRASSPRSTSFLSPSGAKAHNKRRKSNQH